MDKKVLVAIIGVIVAVVAVFGYFTGGFSQQNYALEDRQPDIKYNSTQDWLTYSGERENYTFQYGPGYSVSTGYPGYFVIEENGKEVVSFESFGPGAYGTNIEEYEQITKENLQQNTSEEEREFTPGFTTKTFGNNTVYYPNQEKKLADETDRISGIIYSGNPDAMVLTFSYPKESASKAEAVIATINFK